MTIFHPEPWQKAFEEHYRPLPAGWSFQVWGDELYIAFGCDGILEFEIGPWRIVEPESGDVDMLVLEQVHKELDEFRNI